MNLDLSKIQAVISLRAFVMSRYIIPITKNKAENMGYKHDYDKTMTRLINILKTT